MLKIKFEYILNELDNDQIIASNGITRDILWAMGRLIELHMRL